MVEKKLLSVFYFSFFKINSVDVSVAVSCLMLEHVVYGMLCLFQV